MSESALHVYDHGQSDVGRLAIARTDPASPTLLIARSYRILDAYDSQP